MYSLSRNSCTKAFGNWSRLSDLRSHLRLLELNKHCLCSILVFRDSYVFALACWDGLCVLLCIVCFNLTGGELIILMLGWFVFYFASFVLTLREVS